MYYETHHLLLMFDSMYLSRIRFHHSQLKLKAFQTFSTTKTRCIFYSILPQFKRDKRVMRSYLISIYLSQILRYLRLSVLHVFKDGPAVAMNHPSYNHIQTCTRNTVLTFCSHFAIIHA